MEIYQFEKVMPDRNDVVPISKNKETKSCYVEDLLDKDLRNEVENARNGRETLSHNLNEIGSNISNEIIRAKESETSLENKINAVVTGLDWKEHVATFSDIVTTYPNPEKGWTVSVDNEPEATYRYNGTEWKDINIKTIPKATSSTDGIMTKEDKVKVDTVELNANNYIHPDMHPASMIAEDTTHMFVTAEEKESIKEIKGDTLFQTAGGTGTEITLTLPTILVNGYATTFIASTNNNGAETSINEKKLYKPGTTISPYIVAGKAYTIWYNLASDSFFIKASAEGDADVPHVLATKKFSNINDTGLVGTMPNNGAITITPGTTNKPISLGYHNGQGYVSGDANLISENIRGGKSIFGVNGKTSVVDTSDALATAAHLLAGSSAYVNGIKIAGSIPNFYGAWQYSSGIAPASGRLHMYPPKGYYDPAGGAGIYYDDPNYISANIVNGKSIFGLGGSATLQSLGGKRYAEGTCAVSGAVTIDLGFVPRIVQYKVSSSATWYTLGQGFNSSKNVQSDPSNTNISYNYNTYTCILSGTQLQFQSLLPDGTLTYYAWE